MKDIGGVSKYVLVCMWRTSSGGLGEDIVGLVVCVGGEHAVGLGCI